MAHHPTVMEFLERAHGESFCDSCLALALKLSLLEVRDVVSRGGSPIDRRPGSCSVCGRSLDVACVEVG